MVLDEFINKFNAKVDEGFSYNSVQTQNGSILKKLKN